MPWYVVFTKVHKEFSVAEKLTKSGIEVFCPAITQIKQWSDRKKKVTVPLIKRYVFVQLAENERNRVFGHEGVLNYLFWLGKPALVTEQEISLLQSAAEGKIDNHLFKNTQQGDVMTLKDGAFANNEVVIDKVNKNHVIVMLKNSGIKLILKYDEML